jgi:hypothetical protein
LALSVHTYKIINKSIIIITLQKRRYIRTSHCVLCTKKKKMFICRCLNRWRKSRHIFSFFLLSSCRHAVNLGFFGNIPYHIINIPLELHVFRHLDSVNLLVGSIENALIRFVCTVRYRQNDLAVVIEFRVYICSFDTQLLIEFGDFFEVHHIISNNIRV